jgi:hypothetical protein
LNVRPWSLEVAQIECQLPYPRQKAISAEDGRIWLSFRKIRKPQLSSCYTGMTDQFGNWPPTHQRHIAAGTIVSWKTVSVRIVETARTTKKTVVKEVKRLEIEYLL